MKTKIASIIVLLFVAGDLTGQGVQIGGHIKIESGSVLNVMGNADINNGTLTIDPGGLLLMGNLKNLSVNNGGRIKLIGDDVNQPIISSSGYFYFNVYHGGTISAQNALIERMAENGLYIYDGATIDPDHPLHNCIFQDGSPGSTLLTIENNQILTINGAEFNHTPGIEMHNVVKLNDQGKVTFTNFTGNFGGEEFELDPNARIHWIAVIPFELALQNLSIENGQDTCFDALQMISVAGGGSTFIVESGARAELIAGHRVLLLYGTLIESGGQLHAWITEDASFCQNEKSLIAAKEEVAPGIESDKLSTPYSTAFRIYPNPVTTFLTVEILKQALMPVAIEIYDFVGKCLQSSMLPVTAIHQLNFADYPRGIYLIRLETSYEAVVVKIIKQ